MNIDNILSGASASSDSPKNTTKNNTENKADNNNNVVVSAPASPASPASDSLPLDFSQTLQSIIENWTIQNNIDDMSRAAALQWRACCLFVGQYIKQNRFLYDEEKLKIQGGNIAYKIEKVSQLVDIWEYFCAKYKKTPLAYDFIAFSGVSRQWFFDNSGKRLSSSGGLIWKKVNEIQAGGLASGIVDGRENPTGKIYFSKVLGWSETGGFGSRSDDLQADSGGGLPDLSDFLGGNN